MKRLILLLAIWITTASNTEYSKTNSDELFAESFALLYY